MGENTVSSFEIKRFIVNTVNDLEELKSIWKELERGPEMTVFQSYDWNVLLYREESRKKFFSLFTDMVIYLLKLGESYEVMLPVIIQKHTNETKWFGRKKGIYIWGDGSYSDYLSAIYSVNATSEEFSAIIERIKFDYQKMPIFFNDIREFTRFSNYLTEKAIRVIKQDVSVQVEMTLLREEYEKSLSKSVRQNIRTAKNRMMKAGLDYRIEICGKIDDESLIEKLTEIHIARMAQKNTNKVDLVHAMSSYVRIKYRTNREQNNNIISESMKVMDNSCLVICYLNNDIAGYLYGLIDRDTIRIMQNCVKEDYKFYSPMFRGAYDFILMQYDNDDIKIVDFTRGNEQYKYNLGGVEIQLKSYEI